LQKKSSTESIQRIPPSANEIQVNFCKNPSCDNFGIPAINTSQKRKDSPKDQYTAIAHGKKKPAIKCNLCGETFVMKSNVGINEELLRLSEYLQPVSEPSCTNIECENYHIGISNGKSEYYSFGKTSGGNQRYRCKKCGKTFTVTKSTSGQRLPHKNKLIFNLLMNKMPFKRICEVAEISPKTLYTKIDFIHTQCLKFAAERENSFFRNKTVQRAYISVDRQDYVINWSHREDKRNIKLSAVGSADNESGYVFGMNLNYDPRFSHTEIETLADENSDCDKRLPFRQFARLWLECDYKMSIDKAAMNSRQSAKLSDLISESYEETERRNDTEISEIMSEIVRLPENGMQVHAEYTLYGHFQFLKTLLSKTTKVRFFLDQDSGIRAACLSAFHDRITDRTCDVFYVRINKALTVDEKKKSLQRTNVITGAKLQEITGVKLQVPA
jgi:transposase-like protein